MRSVKVADYMASRLVTFLPSTNVVEAMGTLLSRGISGAPVVDTEGALVGVLSEVDVMKILVQDSYYNEAQGIVGDYMRSPVDTVSADDDIYTVAERFINERRRRFPVVREGRLVGQISRRDVLRAMREFMTRRD